MRFKTALVARLWPEMASKMNLDESYYHLERLSYDPSTLKAATVDSWVVANCLEKNQFIKKRNRDAQLELERRKNGSLEMYHFAHLIYSNHQFGIKDRSQFKRLMKFWQQIWENGLTNDISQRDMGMFIKALNGLNQTRLIDKNQMMAYNSLIFKQLLQIKFPMSNKELFMMLKLPMDDSMYDIKQKFYDQYMQTHDGGDLNETSFLGFLEMNVSMNYSDFKIKDLSFVNRIVQDFQKVGIKPNRFMTYLLFKIRVIQYKQTPHNEIVKQELDQIIEYMFNSFSIDNDMIHYLINSAIYLKDIEMLHFATSIYHHAFVYCEFSNATVDLNHDRFQTRITDELIRISNEDLGLAPKLETFGLLYQIPLSTMGYYGIGPVLDKKFSSQAQNDIKIGQIEAMLSDMKPAVEHIHKSKYVSQLDHLTADEQFDTGEFSALALEGEEQEDKRYVVY